MSDQPLVSVILPVHNGGTFLREAVDSMLQQSHAHLELLLVDDHSDDGAIEGLDRSDGRLRILPSRGNGVVSAFNTGLAQANGGFIARMDADDLSLPRRLEAQLALLHDHPGIGIAGAQVTLFSADGVAGGNQAYERWLNSLCTPEAIRRELFVESPIPNPTALFRRSVIDALGGYRDTNWPEDYDLFLRADGAGVRMAKPEKVLLRWRDHANRLTRKDERYARSRFQAAKAHFLVRHRLDSTTGILLWGAGPSGAEFHDLLVAIGAQVEGFVEVHPRRIGGKKRGLPVWPIEQARHWRHGPILVAVGARGARDEIRHWFEAAGRVEGDDWLFVC